MAELTPLSSVQRPSDSEYEPVSGYAVAAAAITGLFVVALVAIAVQTMIASRAARSWELLVLPIAGFIFAVIARSHIRNSEGTRTGMRLANICWWVSILGGAGFTAYLYANSLALDYESGKFVDQMFNELKAGKTQEAFENYLVAPEERNRVGPNAPPEVFEREYGPSGYTAFRNHEMVHLFQRNGSAVNFERVKIKESGQDAAGLYATHIYRLKCPEGEFEVQVKAVAAEVKKGGKQLWRIPAQPAEHNAHDGD